MRFVVVEAEAKALGWVERRPHPEGAAVSGRNLTKIRLIRQSPQKNQTNGFASPSLQVFTVFFIKFS
jgi:hypothetical protein